MTIFSGHSVISRVYTSRFGNGTVRWNLDRSGTKKVSGTRYSTQWKTPQKWTVPYRTVPYRTMQWKSAINVNLRKDWVRERVKISQAGLYGKRMRTKDRAREREWKGKCMLRVPWIYAVTFFYSFSGNDLVEPNSMTCGLQQWIETNSISMTVLPLFPHLPGV